MQYSYYLSPTAARARLLAWAVAMAAQPLTSAQARRLLALPRSAQKLVYAAAGGEPDFIAQALDAAHPSAE